MDRVARHRDSRVAATAVGDTLDSCRRSYAASMPIVLNDRAAGGATRFGRGERARPRARGGVPPARDRRGGGQERVTKLGGWVGLATAVAAWYASFAAVTNFTFGREMVPVRSLRHA